MSGYSLTIPRNADWSITLTWTDTATGNPIDFTAPSGAVGVLGGAKLVTFTASQPGANAVTFSLTASQTAALSAGTFWWDWFVTTTAGVRVKVFPSSSVAVVNSIAS